ncbi:MAG: hypothetical protein D4R67_05050, partial [Bacteroidetes bacterium]
STNATIRLWYRLLGSSGAYTDLDADMKPTGIMNGTYTWNTSLAALSQGTYQFYIAARDYQGPGTGIWVYPMWATTWTGWAAGDPPNFTANPDAAANGNTFVKQANLAGGTYEVGDDQPVLKKLTHVAAQLSSSILLGNVTYEMNSTYNGTTGETYPLVFTQYSTSGGNWTVTIRVKSGAGPRTLSGSSATQLINLNGIKNLTIDGREDGSGSTKSFTILNTNTSGSTVQFINDARNNTLKYCTIKGVETSTTLGVIVFSTTTGSSGNSNNLIDYCDIGDGPTTPANLIYASGTTGFPNSTNTVSNCNLFNWFLVSTTSQTSAINLLTGSSDWTITGNSFYQTATRTYTSSGVVSAIAINNAVNGYNFAVTNNFIGGSASSCGGTAMTLSATTGTPAYDLIYITTAYGTASTIQGNTVSNIAMTTANTGYFGFIYHINGNINILNNTFGSQTATGNITVTNSGTSTTPVFCGILTGGGGAYSTINVTGNTLGGISISTSSTGATAFRIVYSQAVYGSILTISNNSIGGTVANSIVQNTNTIMPAIMVLNPTIGNIITNNTIRNLSINNTGITGSLTGINMQSSGGHTITGNTIYNLTTNSTNVAINNAASIVGLTMTALTTPGTNISQNTIYNLSNTNTTVAGCINGMYFATPAAGQTIISRNFVHSFSTASATSSQTGIFVPNTGIAMVYNNMVRLGIDGTGAALTNSVQINGIWKASTGNVGMYFNSVYIGGSGVVSGAVNTYAYRRSSSGVADTLVNNIFVNNRSNTSGTGKHYGIYTNASTNLVCNYNLYQTTGTGGVLGINVTTDYATIAAWRGGTNLDIASGYGDPDYIAPSGTSATVDLHVQSPTAIEAAGTALASITTDYDGAARAGLTPVDIGADAGNFTSSGDIFPPNILYTPLSNGTTANRVLPNFATITDNVGVSGGASLPRIYYKKSGDQNLFVGNTSSDNGWKYVIASNSSSPYSFTINYAIINGGSVVNGDVIQYFVVAQDAANNLSSNVGGAGASGNPPVQNINAAPATPLSYTIAGSVSSPLTVGTGGTYPSLTGGGGAFAAINAGVATGNLVIQVLSNLTEDGTNALNQLNEDPPGSNFTVTIQPGDATVKLISGAVANGMIRLDGADRVTIDGRSGGSGMYLRFRNTNTSNPTFTFLNDATSNTIRNCYIEGANSGSSSGVIVFSTTTGLVGNDNNTLTQNIIRDRSDATGVPYSLIYSSGTALKENSGITISDNELLNFSNNGIIVTSTGNGDSWTITGNSFYNTLSTPPSTAQYSVYFYPGVVSNGNSISNNFIGGSSASCGGSAWVNSGAVSFYGIYVNAGIVTATTVQNNILRNISQTSTGSAPFYGFYAAGGVNTFSGNTIGSSTGTPSINSAGTGTFQGFYLATATNQPTIVQNNTLQDIALGNTGSQSFYGVYASSGLNSVLNNTFGSTTTANAITMAGTGTAYGIYSGCNSTINENNIANIRQTGTSPGTFYAMYFTGNYNFTVNANYIVNDGPTAASTGSNDVTGMLFYGASSGTMPCTLSNNLISLGHGISTNHVYKGVDEFGYAGNNIKLYYNSISIGGTSTGSSASYAYVTRAAVNEVHRNNIYSNTRTNGGSGSGKHYAFGATTVSGVINSNYNDLYTTGAPLAIWSATDQANLAAWQTTSMGDAASKAVNPNFFSTTDLHTCQSDLDGAGIAVSGITTDYAGVTRGNPPDIGAYEFSIPIPTITGATPICAGSTGVTYTTESGMTAYSWAVSSGGNITAGGSTNQITVTWNTAGPQTISVNYTNANGCSASTPTVKNVTVNALPVPTITGPTPICSPSAGNIYSTEAGQNTYLWNTSIAGTIMAGAGTNQITVTWNGSGAQNVTVNYTDANGCTAANATQFDVTVYPAFAVGSISADQSICYNTTPLQLDGLAPTGGNTPYTYQWQSSSDNVTFTDIPLATNLNYSPGTLTQTTYYRLNQTSASSCGTLSTNTVTIIVYPNFVVGSISSDQSICYNAAPSQLVGVAPTGGNAPYSYQWQSSTDNLNFTDIPLATNLNYSPGALTQTTYYRLNQTSTSSCGTLTTDTVTITVYPDFIVGSISANQSICSGTIPGKLIGVAPSGGNTPYSYQWQSSTDNITFTDISFATGIDYQPGTLTQTTYYRLNQSSASSCGTLVTNTVTITVNALPVPVVTGPSVVCPGFSGFIYFTATGMTGYAWTISGGGTIDLGQNTNQISVSWNTSGAQYVTVTYTDGNGCNPVTPTTYDVTVNTTITPVITGPASSCAGTTGVLYTTDPGNTGYSWTISTGGTITSGATNQTATVTWVTAGSQSITVVYVDPNGCTVNPVTKIVTVNDLPTPTLSGPTPVCYGSTGNVYTTQASMTNYSWNVTGGNITAGGTSTSNTATVTWTSSGSQSISVNYTNGNGCTAATATSYPVSVYQQFAAGTISSNQSICYNTTPAQLTGTAPTGGNTPYSYQWQNSTDNITFTNISGAISLNYQPSALTVTTYYRLNQSSASSCGTVTTNTVTITVYGNFVAGTISASQSICYNTPPLLLNGTAPTGGNTPYTYQWQNSTDNVTFTNISGATSLTYQPPALTVTTYYRLNQTSASGCGTVTTNTVTITVYPNLVAGTIAANQSICYNTAPALLTGTAPTGGNTPYTYQWQSSPNGTTWTNITGATSLNYQPPALTATTYYRLNQSSASGCGTVTTNTVTITVYPNLVAGTI